MSQIPLKPFSRVVVLLAALSLSANFARGVTLTAAYTTTAQSDSACNPGPRSSTFLTTDPVVWLYVLISNGAMGDNLEADWIRPDGKVYDAILYSALTSPGTWCFDGAEKIAGASAAQYPGTWTIRLFWNSTPLTSLTFNLNQPGTNCTYSISPTSGQAPDTGASFVVQVTTQTGCAWTAASNASWLRITSGASGSGNGQVTIASDPNTTTASRSGTATIAGQTFTVTQAAAAGGPPCTPTSGSLIGNGSFELPGNAGSITTLIAGTASAATMPCWTVTNGTIDYVGTYWKGSDGGYSLDMDGTSPGSVVQTFATTPGAAYTVSFDLAGNSAGGAQPKLLQVSAGSGSQPFSFDSSTKSTSNMGWVRKSLTFTANRAMTTLQFASGSPAGSMWGAALDNVCVAAGTTPCGGGGGPTLTITLAPSTATNPVGSQYTVTANVTDQNNNPQPNVAVTFTILSGPNAGASGVCSPSGCLTGANGQVSFTYTGSGGPGQDSITACINAPGSLSGRDCCSAELGVVSAANVRAAAVPGNKAVKSGNVVIIGAASVDPNCSTGANRITNGGCLPVTGKAGDLGDFSFAGMAPTSVSAASLAAYDTAVLNVASSGMGCTTAKLSAQAKSDLVSFVGAGKKLIIYDSECQASGNTGLDYSWLPYPFTTANPGAQGAQGTLNIVENSTLASSVTGSASFVDAADLSNNTDAVGDMNVMTTKDAHWCLAMSGTNALKVTGPVLAYAKYPAGTDSGLFIYNGLDQDSNDNLGNPNLRKVWVLELQEPFNPSNLPCGVAVVGITLAPGTATNQIGTQHTVTAKVIDQLGQPQANVAVAFTVSGTNANAAGACSPSSCKTDVNGQVTFTYTGSNGVGQDTIQACFTPSGGGTPVCSAPATKTWVQQGGGGGTTLCATPVAATWVAGGPVCNYFVQPLSNIGVPAAGTRNGFFQIFTGLQCKWGAISNDSWITIIAGASGSGSPGAVSYSVAANPTSAPRTGTITITDGSKAVQTHTVVQLPGGPPCTYGLSPLYGGAPATGGGGGTLLTTASSCFWLAVPNDPWVHVTPSSGYGSQILSYSADVNTTPNARSGTIGIMGQTFAVYQAAPSAAVPPGTPSISQGGIVNAASSRAGPVARGSFFTIYGTNIGPAVPVQATTYPIPDTAGGVVVNIAQGSVVKRAYLHFVSSTQINGIIPSDAPFGDVQITVTYNGTVGVSATATLVDTSFGIFSASSGIGPGIIQNWNSPTDVVLNLPSIPGKPEQLAIMWGTGMGPIAVADNGPPPAGDLPVPVQVEVAGLPATVVYHGRAPGFAGVDNIYFYVPKGVAEGCSVPVRVKAGPSWSNTVRMAINSSGSLCQDPVNPNATLSSTGGKLGAILLMRASMNGQFQANQAPANATLDLGMAVFAEIKAGGPLAFSGALNLPPVGSCASNTKPLDFSTLLGGDLLGQADSTVNRQLDAGPKLTVSGPAGSVDLTPMGSNAGSYVGLLGGTAPLAGSATMPLFLTPGSSLSITSPGGKDVGPVSANITLPNGITWTNRDQIGTVDRTMPLTINWTGGDATQLLVIAGGAQDDKTKHSGGFFCLVDSTKGTFSVPVSVLADVPATRPLTGTPNDAVGGIALVSVPKGTPPTFNASGPDNRFVVVGSVSLKTVQIQ